MKKLLIPIFIVASSLCAQVQLGKGVQVGGSSSGGGATLPSSAITFGLSSTTSRAAVPSDVSGLLQGATGCTVAGSVYSPITNTCFVAAGPTSGTLILKGNGTGGFSGAAAGTDYITPSLTGQSITSTASAFQFLGPAGLKVAGFGSNQQYLFDTSAFSIKSPGGVQVFSCLNSNGTCTMGNSIIASFVGNDGCITSVTGQLTSTGTPCGSGGGGSPGGTNQDVQINLSSVFGADPGNFVYNNTTHQMGLFNFGNPNAYQQTNGNAAFSYQGANFQRGMTPNGNAGNAESRYFTLNYWQSKRFAYPEEIFTRDGVMDVQCCGLNVDNGSINIGYDTADIRNHAAGQAGGWETRNIYNAGIGDNEESSIIDLGTGSTRGFDEGNGHRSSRGWLNHNYGGTYTALAVASNNDQPATLTPTSAYNGIFSWEQAPMLNTSAGVAKGNLRGCTATDSNTTMTCTVDAPHGYAITNQTVLTAAIDSQVYTGCPATGTGVLYPTIEPNINNGDGFSTDADGIGLPQRNANYVNAPGGAMVGYCVTVGSTSNMAAGDTVYISGTDADFESATVMSVVDSTHFRAFIHFAHSSGIVSWDNHTTVSAANRATGRALVIDQDVLPTNARVGNISGNHNTGPSYIGYPIIAAPSTTTVKVWPNSGGSSGAEVKSRFTCLGCAGTPPTLTLNGSFPGPVTSITYTQNNYGQLPAPSITFTGCTTNPTIAVTPDATNSLGTPSSYVFTVTAGGNCNSGATAVAQSLYPAPVTIYPFTMSQRVVDTNGVVDGCSTVYPYPCSDTDGFVLLQPWNIPPTTGDLIVASEWWQRYYNSQDWYEGDWLTANTGRDNVARQVEYFSQLSGGAISNLAYNDFSPTSQYYGDFAHGYAPNPAEPFSGTRIPPNALGFYGAGNKLYWQLPPSVNSFGGMIPALPDAVGANIGGYLLTVGCTNVNTFKSPQVDAQCFHGVFNPYGIFHNDMKDGKGKFGYDPENHHFDFDVKVQAQALAVHDEAQGGQPTLVDLPYHPQAGAFNYGLCSDMYDTNFNFTSTAVDVLKVCAVSEAGAGFGGWYSSFKTDTFEWMRAGWDNTDAHHYTTLSTESVLGLTIAGTDMSGTGIVYTGTSKSFVTFAGGSTNLSGCWNIYENTDAVLGLQNCQDHIALNLPLTSLSFGTTGSPSQTITSFQGTSGTLIETYEGTAPTVGHLLVVGPNGGATDGGAIPGGTPIANIVLAVSAGTITANSCTSPVSSTMTGLLTSSSVSVTPQTQPSLTGWTPGLYIEKWPTANTLNWQTCNSSATPIITTGTQNFNASAQ